MKIMPTTVKLTHSIKLKGTLNCCDSCEHSHVHVPYGKLSKLSIKITDFDVQVIGVVYIDYRELHHEILNMNFVAHERMSYSVLIL